MINSENYEDNRTQLFFSNVPVNKNRDVALLALVGGWLESNQYDKQLIETLVKEPYEKWIERIRGYRDDLVGYVDYEEQRWSVSNREVLWSKYAPYLYEEHLRDFKKVFITLYSTPDPSLELEPKERFAATIYGKEFPYSKLLSTSLIDSLMLIELHQEALSSISLQLCSSFVSNTIKELLFSADWKVWAGIQNELSKLAELAPNTFLQCLTKALDDKPSLIMKLYEQESSGGVGPTNYLTGIVWALEVLAWEPNSLQRVVITLAKLDLMDTNRDSNWANKPGKVLPTILLPWIANNSADFTKYLASLKALLRLNKQLAWDVGCNLLTKRSSFGTAKPKWRSWALSDAEREVPRTEAIKRYEEIGRLLVQTAEADTTKLAYLVEVFHELTPSVLSEALSLIESKLSEIDLEGRDNLWEKLSALVDKHMLFAQQVWAMSTSQVEQIDKLASLITPSNLTVKHKRLFSNDWRGRRKFEDYKVQDEFLLNERKLALREILDSSDFDTIFELVGKVDSPYMLGKVLATILMPEEVTSQLLLTVLRHPNREFSSITLSMLHEKKPHLFPFEESNWEQQDKLELYLLLPATPTLWSNLENTLSSELMEKYWCEANINPYAIYVFNTHQEVVYCLTQLFTAQRYGVVTNLLYNIKRRFEHIMDESEIYELLIRVAKDSESVKVVEPRAVLKLIKALQNSEILSLNKKSELEALYFPWISDNDSSGVTIKAINLEERIAKAPLFFMTFLKAAYSKDDEVNESFARLAYQVLSGVKRAPGVLDESSFCVKELEQWLKTATQEAIQLQIDIKVLRHWIGKTLFYAPKTSDGLWLPEVLEVLNADDNSDLLEAFDSEIFCSRGVRIVDLTGKEEFDLAKQYRELSELAELEGFYNVYPVLLRASESFQQEAEETLSGKRYSFPYNVT
ncbi:hypothetical protein CWO23_00800 [Vibrio splendidus]|uniref:hypothetical protein n=1 Tax=Vibrio splendidus TaxID=29497 RepID=UPI000D3858E3|nr:hypothetical protein [Vibrio splendidus]PTP78494.1 hypothetical protein CWO23_00800 [Vibrio splendidus]